VTVRSVDTLVSRLRRRIEPREGGGQPRYIHTVRGVGYKLGDV
jgi:DNA-binding response OmpR family regulator